MTSRLPNQRVMVMLAKARKPMVGPRTLATRARCMAAAKVSSTAWRKRAIS
jgi:hypothetical protein